MPEKKKQKTLRQGNRNPEERIDVSIQVPESEKAYQMMISTLRHKEELGLNLIRKRIPSRRNYIGQSLEIIIETTANRVDILLTNLALCSFICKII